MKLIELKCPNCHAKINVNEDLETVFCNYCGTKFRVEDENETKEERIIKTKAKMEEKSKDAERKYYASEDYAKKLNIEAEAGDKSILGSLGRQIQKSREYYSSDEYKKRLEMQNEQTKKTFKTLMPLLIILFMLFFVSLIFSFNGEKEEELKDDMSCTMEDKEYVIVIEKNKDISCANCTDDMLELFNSKYLDKDSVSITKKNIRSYFSNNEGKCRG